MQDAARIVTPHAAAVTLAEGLARTLRIAEALHEAGRRIDLAGLEELVGRLCAGTLDLPPEQGRALRPTLIALRDQAERLATALHPTPADSPPPWSGPPPDH